MEMSLLELAKMIALPVYFVCAFFGTIYAIYYINKQLK